MIKGFGSGMASLVLSRLVGEGEASLASCVWVMLLGFCSIGLSVYFYVLAQAKIGAAKTSAYYAVAPFVGVLLSLVLFREIPGMMFWLSFVIMALGVYVSLDA